MSTALVCVCQRRFGPVMVVEQLELVPTEDMAPAHVLEVCLVCDWWRARDVAEMTVRY